MNVTTFVLIVFESIFLTLLALTASLFSYTKRRNIKIDQDFKNLYTSLSIYSLVFLFLIYCFGEF